MCLSKVLSVFARTQLAGTQQNTQLRFFWLSLKPKSLKLNEITKKHSTVRLIEKPNSRIVRDKNWDVLPWFSAMWVDGSKFYNSETGNPT